MGDGEIADGAVLLVETHASADTVMQAFVDVEATFGLTVNTPKMVFIAVDSGIKSADWLSLQARGNKILHNNQFKNFESMITPRAWRAVSC